MGGLEAAIQAINDPINAVVWGWPTVGLIALTGVGLMLGLRFMPLQRLSYGIAMMLRPADLATDGEITPFQALMTSLSATIGTGNIAGVAGAIAVGGPGPVFWMWVIALFGIATKYAEAVLAVRFRETDASGQHVGGPMYYIVNGLGNGWAWMAILFALFGMLAGFGIGNGVQAFEVSSALSLIGVPKLVTGIALGALVFAVVIGGIQRIAQAASSIVPLMSVLYVGACLVVLLLNAGAIPEAFVSIVRNAFTGEAAAGGALGQVILMGFKRGIFSNEAGLGSAPIAHAAAKTTDPVRQGTVAMLGTFIDTLIICTMTALVIITTGAHERLDGAGQRLSGADLSIAAFNSGLPGSGTVVTIGLVVFAFTTILGWSFYGERCTTFLFGENAVLPFRLVWVAVVVMGAVAGDRGVVWSIADTLNGLMALPNLVALLLLSGTVIKLTKAYRFSD